MKFLFLIAVIYGAYYFYTNNKVESIEVNNGKELFKKLKTSPVTKEDIINSASFTALKLCDDETFQNPVGHTPSSCRKRFNSFKDMCVERIFISDHQQYSQNDGVKGLYKRFIKCVGT